MPEDFYSKLLAILDEQVQLHVNLRSCLEYELANDGQLDSNDFLGVQRQKQSLAERSRIIENKRLQLFNNSFTEHLPRLAEIIKHAPDQHANKLTQYRLDLSKLADQIKHLTQKTSARANARLIAINSTLKAIYDYASRYSVYSSSGTLANKPPSFRKTSV